MPSDALISGYKWRDAKPTCAHKYLLPELSRILRAVKASKKGADVFDLGSGNGSVAAWLTTNGFNVVGVDPSTEGVKLANLAHPGLKLNVGSAYDDLACLYGQFSIVVSLEVVEHVYDPRRYAACLYSLTCEGGTAVVSAPYHGYWKNLALAITGQMDKHFTALWDHGHIKFWSMSTLQVLLLEAGFRCVEFRRVGRIPPLAKSMIAIAMK
jgi:2-polyprenyl-6-hydroxyphenyl methylase/3-demethylubiquinone-9 3-methyltransferase